MIPISKPSLGMEERDAVARVLEKGQLAQGEEVERFEQEWASYIGTKFAVATNSGTSALHIALACLGIKEGDKVITTPFSFIATASSIVMQGATPVFCDIAPRTYNLDPQQLGGNIDENTKAIMVVHLYGQPCDMAPILEIAREHNLHVIEDACQAHGAEYRGKKAGSIGHIGVFSFYPTKNITTGEGGMLTTNDTEIAEKARMLRDHGQGQRYRHEILGYNYRMTNIAAAIGSVQLKKLEQLNEKRIDNAGYYNKNLNTKIQKPGVIDGVKHVFHQYTIRVKDRRQFTNYLEQKGVGYGIYYPIPIHRQPLFIKHNALNLPMAQEASGQVVSLPVYPSLTREELEYIAEVVNSFESW